MTPILIACSVASSIMFCLFFVIPSLDRAGNSKAAGRTVRTKVAMGSRRKLTA
jgi:hypothetical protein